MKKIKILLSMCAFLWTGMVFAVGSGAGNGGDAVVCYSDSTRQVIQSVQMFDYWEQEQVVHLPDGIQLGAVNASLQEKIDISINRLGYFNTTLADQIRPVAMSIANNINSFLVTSYQLPDINDANPRAIPSAPNCFIEQFAVQWKEPTTGQRKFAIAAKFFNFTGTSNDTKVGIILHEAYYRYALQNGVNDSDGTRYLNYVLATNYLNDHDLVKYSDLLNDSKYNFNKCTLQTLPFLNQRTLVSNLDQLKWQKTCSNIYLNKQNLSLTIEAGAEVIDLEDYEMGDHLKYISLGGSSGMIQRLVNGQWVIDSGKVNIKFYENGYIHIGELSKSRADSHIPYVLNINGNSPIICNAGEFNSFGVSLDQNNKIIGCNFDSADVIISQQAVKLFGGALIYANGSLRMSKLHKNSTPLNLKISGANRIFSIARNGDYWGNTGFYLNPQGEIDQATLVDLDFEFQGNRIRSYDPISFRSDSGLMGRVGVSLSTNIQGHRIYAEKYEDIGKYCKSFDNAQFKFNENFPSPMATTYLSEYVTDEVLFNIGKIAFDHIYDRNLNLIINNLECDADMKIKTNEL